MCHFLPATYLLTQLQWQHVKTSTYAHLHASPMTAKLRRQQAQPILHCAAGWNIPYNQKA